MKKINRFVESKKECNCDNCNRYIAKYETCFFLKKSKTVLCMKCGKDYTINLAIEKVTNK